jgi:O-antigen/teichoic acid export membrane protein
MLGASLRAMLEAAQRFDIVNLIRTPASVAVLVIPAIAAPLGAGLPLIVLLLVLVRLAAAIASLAVIDRVIPEFRWRLHLSWPALRPLLGYGAWVTVSNIVGPLLVYLERFMLAALAGVAAVGYYTAPAEAAMRLLIIPAGLASALFPAVSSARTASTSRFVARPLRVLLLTLGPVVLVIALAAGPLLQRWLGADYAAHSAAALAILAIGVLINGLTHVPYAYLLGRGRPDLPAKFHLIELPLYVGMAWVLIGRFGITGAALAWTLRVSVDAALLAAAVWGRQALGSAAHDAPGEGRLSAQQL